MLRARMSFFLGCRLSFCTALAIHTKITGVLWPWMRSRKEFLKGPETLAALQQSRKFKWVPFTDKELALSLKWVYCSNPSSFFKHKHFNKWAKRMPLQIFFFSVCKYNHQYLAVPTMLLTASACHSNQVLWKYGHCCTVSPLTVKPSW